MKIICMDCQTESHVDPETVKGKKHIECDHCAAEFRVNSGSQITETAAWNAREDARVISDSIPGQLPEDDVQWLDDEDVLDISVVPFAPSYPAEAKADELISLAPDEAKALALFAETPAPDSGQTLENHTAENIVQPLPEPALATEPSTPAAALVETPLPLAEKPLPKSGATISPSEPKKVRLLAFSTPKLITIAATLILFISLVGMLNSPVGEVSLKAQSPASAALSQNEKVVEKKTAEAKPAPVTEVSEPAPSPSPVAAPENINTATTPPANQPAVSEPVANQPTASEASTAVGGKLTIQVGSHNQMGLADGQAEKLRAAGYDPRVVSVDIPKRGRWYRVQVGNFPGRQEAQQFGSQLVSKGVVENFVIAEN